MTTTDPLCIAKKVALECLLDDQIRQSIDTDDSYGSWGRTTLDYCFLATMEPFWRPGTGSITQTAWALLSFSEVRSAFAEEDRIVRAVSAADRYVAAYLRALSRATKQERSERAKYRHSATALLCELLLEELSVKSNSNMIHDFLPEYATLLQELSKFLQHTLERGGRLPTDLSLLALYPLMIARFSEAVANKDSTKGLNQSLSLLNIWRDNSDSIVEAAVHLLGNYDPRATPEVSAASVWAAFLDATTILGNQDDHIGKRARALHAEVARESIKRLNRIRNVRLPIFNDGVLWEPWSVLALTSQLGKEFSEWSKSLAMDIIDQQRSSSTKPIPGGCTHIWSILVR